MIKGINDIKNEIEIIEKIEENTELFDDYLEYLINFAADSVDDLEKLNDLYEDLSKKICEFAEKLGEKKTVKFKDILQPICNFFKTFK